MSTGAKRPRSGNSAGAASSSSAKRPAVEGPEGGPSQPPERICGPEGGLAERYIRCIQQAIVQIYRRDVSTLHFSSLYSAGHFLLQSGHGMRLYRAVETIVRALLLHWVTQRLLPSPDEVFLEVLLELWADHLVAIGLAAKLTMQLDKSDRWSGPGEATKPATAPSSASSCQTEAIDAAGADVMLIPDLGVHLFGVIFKEHAAERCRQRLLRLVRRERDGEIALERGLLRGLADMMVTISLDGMYVPELEAAYLQDAEEYFTVEAAENFQRVPVVEYLQRALRRLDEEEARARNCLHPSTLPKLRDCLHAVLLHAYDRKLMEREQSGVHSMLVGWRLDGIQVAYTAFRRVNHLKPLVDEVANFCRDEGLKLVSEKAAPRSATHVVDDLIALRARFTDLIKVCFKYTADGKEVLDVTFITAVHTAFKDIMKGNPRIAEYLSSYLDAKFQTSRGSRSLSDEEAEQVCDDVLVLFDYLQDKDVFEKVYKSHLAKRLLPKFEVNDHERLFVSKMKAAHGHACTNHLETMFSDVVSSAEVMGAYREATRGPAKEKPAVELAVTVLTQVRWPLVPAPLGSLPPEMSAPAEDFKRFYEQKYTSGRRLTFCHHHGTADVWLTANARRYEVSVTTPQAIILLLFNGPLQWTVRDIQSSAQIDFRELKRALQPLCLGKPKVHPPILKRVKLSVEEDGSAAESKELTPETRLVFDPQFSSRLTKIRLAQLAPRETSDVGREAVARVEDERKHITECAIVRIMKARRQMRHQDLVVELMKQLGGRFQPQPAFLKQRIEDLIAREYLKRDAEERALYHYMA